MVSLCTTIKNSNINELVPCRVIALIILFVEIPLCLKFCPTSPKFDAFISRFENSWFRAIMYLAFAIVMFLSHLLGSSTLIVCGVVLLLSAISYRKSLALQKEHITNFFFFYKFSCCCHYGTSVC
ncbi:hypothetical protein BDF21DRAFT_408927 [Thamnidium elegans]|nr:hypothetical protein BDF21DRAFT_408927 [Thamnidium elegans]